MSELHQSLMNKAYDRWNTTLKGVSKEAFHDSLDAQERFAVHTGNFNYQVENGGFIQWWCNCYGTPSTVEYLLRACDRINTESAANVKELLTKFKESVPSKNPRQHMDEDEWEKFSNSLDGMDMQYYAINEQFMMDCEAHLKKGGH